MKDIDLTNLLTILSWPITFLLGLASSLIFRRVDRQKKVLYYSIITEMDIFTPEQFQDFEIPIGININGVKENNLSTVRLRVGNKGNIELKNLPLIVRFPDETKLHFEKIICDSKSYRETIEVEKQSDFIKFNINHINKDNSFEIDFILSDYLRSSINVELAAPGVDFVKIEPTKWDVPVGLLSSFSIGLFGVKLDANAQQTSLLVREISGIRKIIESDYYQQRRESRRKRLNSNN